MLIHMCRRCGFQSKIFQEWADHLWGQQHQTVSRASFLKWSDEDNLKSLVIYAPAPPYPLPSDVISLFLNRDIMVTDFVCWTDRPQNFVIQFCLKEDVENVLKIMRQQPSELKFGGNALGLRRKSDISDFEWPGLVGDATAGYGSSRNPVLIELSDDSNSNSTAAAPPANARTKGRANGNADVNGASTRGNRDSRPVSMEVDEVTPSTSSGSSKGKSGKGPQTSSTVVENYGEDFEIETKMSDEFRDTFLSKITSSQQGTSKDDKKRVKKNLARLQSLWLDIYVDFHNKLWPLCFVMSNKQVKTTRNEVGFEARFICECSQSKFNLWLNKNYIKQEKLDTKIGFFLKTISDENKAAAKLTKIRESSEENPEQDKTLFLKFRCYLLVTFSEGGDVTAKMQLDRIRGQDPASKMKLLRKVYKKLFLQYEKVKLEEWCNADGALTKESEKGTNDNWTQIEVVTVE